MTGPPPPSRKPYEPPYAALRVADTASPDKVEPQPASAAHDMPPADGFGREAEKLEQLRAALWAAFEAGPAAGIPATLIDLTIAYTNALRLELNLLGLRWHRLPQGMGQRVSAAQPRSKP